MTISIEKQSGCEAELRAEVPAETVSQERKKALQAFTREVKIPGFRPGKVPADMIEKRYGESVDREVDQRLLNEAVSKGLKDHEDLRVLDVRESQKPDHKEDGSRVYLASLVLAPEFDLPDYKGIEIEVPKSGVTDEAVEEQLEGVRQRFADYEDITDRAVRDGDLAIIDYTSTIDGKPMDEVAGEAAKPLASNEGYWIKIEQEAFFPGFTEELVGLKVGDEKDITVTLPEDFPLEVLRGTEALFHVKVTGLKEETLPELDDSFAEKLQPGKTLDDIRGLIRNDLQRQWDQKLNELKVGKALEKIEQAVDFELPEAYLVEETQGQADRLVQEATQKGASPEELEAQREELFALAGVRARTNLKTNFLLTRIAEEEKLQVTNEDLYGRIAVLAKGRKTSTKKYLAELKKNNQIGAIRNQLILSKAIDFILEHAKVTETEQETPVQEEQ